MGVRVDVVETEGAGDVMEMEAAVDVMEMEAAVDVVERPTKKQLGAAFKKRFGVVLKKLGWKWEE